MGYFDKYSSIKKAAKLDVDIDSGYYEFLKIAKKSNPGKERLSYYSNAYEAASCSEFCQIRYTDFDNRWHLYWKRKIGILKEIEFPRPISTIVRQHHERLDGSGYPLGIKGDEILLESRIAVVSDVVEAITSERPYRGAAGKDVDMKEIFDFRGIKYDAEALRQKTKRIPGEHILLLRTKAGQQ